MRRLKLSCRSLKFLEVFFLSSNHLTVLDLHGSVDHALHSPHRWTKMIAGITLWPHAPASTRTSDARVKSRRSTQCRALLLLLPLLLLEELAVVPAALRAVGALGRRDPLHQDGDLDRLVLPARRRRGGRRRRRRRMARTSRQNQISRGKRALKRIQ